MNSVMYAALNADIPVMYKGVIVHIHVKCVIRRSVIRGVC